MLTEVADGVWVRQSEWVWSNAAVVRGADGLLVVDPGISGDDLAELADDVDRLGTPVIAGFSTHPDWDHVLWHERFGEKTQTVTVGAKEQKTQDFQFDAAAASLEFRPGSLEMMPAIEFPMLMKH